MTHHTYAPTGVCTRKIDFDIEDGKIHNLAFEGGCNGNLKAIGKLAEGRSADELEELLLGNDCGGRGTSCADQFARAIKQALE